MSEAPDRSFRPPAEGERHLEVARDAQPPAMTSRERLSVRPDSLEGPYFRVFKPALDRVAGILLSFLLAPIVGFFMLMVRAKMGKPALFKQIRVGRGGEAFTVYKLRTMAEDRRGDHAGYAGPERRVNHKSEDDPRHTSFGRFLRKWSLDELPQFWNVARGSMSVVGPRPELPEVVGRYEPWQHDRHLVNPGVTGLWQVSVRGDRPMHEATEIDIEYVQNVSFRLDLSILLKTIPAALGRRKGA